MMRKIARAQTVGCTVGSLEGLMPGAGGTLASFIAYNEAKRWSKEPDKFGKGSEEGVAAPESANFEAENGIRDLGVTGVKPCAGPIYLMLGALTCAMVASSPTVRCCSESRTSTLNRCGGTVLPAS